MFPGKETDVYHTRLARIWQQRKPQSWRAAGGKNCDDRFGPDSSSATKQAVLSPARRRSTRGAPRAAQTQQTAPAGFVSDRHDQESSTSAVDEVRVRDPHTIRKKRLDPAALTCVHSPSACPGRAQTPVPAPAARPPRRPPAPHRASRTHTPPSHRAAPGVGPAGRPGASPPPSSPQRPRTAPGPTPRKPGARGSERRAP